MSNTDRIPVLVFDDGTPDGATTLDRALTVEELAKFHALAR